MENSRLVKEKSLNYEQRNTLSTQKGNKDRVANIYTGSVHKSGRTIKLH